MKNLIRIGIAVLIAFCWIIGTSSAAINPVSVCWVIGTSNGAIDPDNIMGMWLFNEGSGNTAKDSSGNKNDGKINGGVKWVDGKFGKALEFNGSDGWVEVSHSNTVGFKKGVSFTITVHFKGTKVGGSLVGKNYEDTSQALPWYLLWNGGGDNKVTLYLRNSASTSFRADSTSEIGDDEWHFVVGRADASSGKASIWIDGEMEAEVDFDKNDGYGTSDGVLHIARHFDRYTAGIIDDVALFNVALSEDDMEALMNNGVEEAAAVEPANKLTTKWAKIKRQ
ncbi:LamG domain-containing protein [Candidatus Poribacteria bacterium]|nr:LamG domain-containing protein [Candidatus Poribacteria bacterium]